jgi:hypothetical protein
MVKIARRQMTKPPETPPPDEQESKRVAEPRRQRDRGAAQRLRQQLFDTAYLAMPPEYREDFYEATEREWT